MQTARPLNAASVHPPTVYRPEYYQGLINHRDAVLKKASEALEKQEEQVSVVKKAVHSQEVFNYQLRDATTGLIQSYEALKTKNEDYRKYISLLEKQQKLLTKRVSETNSRRLDREQKTTAELIDASKKRDEIVDSLREFRDRFVDLEKRYSELNDMKLALKVDLEKKNDLAETLLAKEKSVAEHNKKLRQVLRLEQEAVQLVEHAEHRRLDQLSLLDPIYADYLKKRWAVDSGRTLHEWELSRFGSLVPPLVDPTLSGPETKRHMFDRIKVLEPLDSKGQSPALTRSLNTSRKSSIQPLSPAKTFDAN